jgi:putative PIN family toxin of toxin-antitoxin system
VLLGRVDILWDVTYNISMRAVADTSVLVAGLRSQLGASSLLLAAIARRRVRPLVTTAVLLEYEAVLLRPEHRLATNMSEADVEGFLRALAAAAEPVEISFRWRPQLRDPADELLLEAAVNGQAEAIVTHNVTDFEPASSRFGVRILTPAQLLKELRKP